MQQTETSATPQLSIFSKLLLNFRRYGLRRFGTWTFHQLEWRWLKNWRHIRFAERKIQGFRLILDLDDVGVSKELFLSDVREEEHIFMLEQFVKPGMKVLDCGANIGYYTVMIGRLVGSAGKMYAIEPDTGNFQLLTMNVRLNKIEERVELYNIGVGDKSGTGTMYHSKMSNRHTFHPVEYVGPSEQTLADRPPTDVVMTTVPDFTIPDRQVDLMRMDVEGYEVEILSGMKTALNDPAFAPAILFEVHRPRYDVDKHDIRAPLSALFSAGYKVKWLAADGYKSRKTREHYDSLGYGDAAVVAYFSSSDRAVFRDISNDHALDLISMSSDVRAVFLERAHKS